SPFLTRSRNAPAVLMTISSVQPLVHSNSAPSARTIASTAPALITLIFVDTADSLGVDAFDRGAAARQFVLEPLEAAVEMVDAVDRRFALGGKRGDHRRALKPLDALDGRGFAAELDVGAEPHQLLHVHEAVLEDGLGDARGAA